MFFRGGGTVHSPVFYHIINEVNILRAWKKFKKGKINKHGIQEFSFYLEKYIHEISNVLKSKTYKPLPYREFYVYDPKKRNIHAAEVIDRVVQQALFQIIEPVFERYFIYDSYSSRLGTHTGINRLESFIKKETKNYNKTAYVLKCDIRKFFDSIDHVILKSLIQKSVYDEDVLWLINIVIDSFYKTRGKGLPLGNVTSQLFGNVYMHVFDHFIKHDLKIKYYVRYCDDFVIVHQDKLYLESIIPIIEEFLKSTLHIQLHEKKREVRKISQGIDFLGYILLPHYRLVRNTTKKRIFRKYKTGLNEAQKQSYGGVLGHARSYIISKKLKEIGG